MRVKMPVPEAISAMTDAGSEPAFFLQQIDHGRRIAGPVANIVSHARGKALGRIYDSHENSLTRERLQCRRERLARAAESSLRTLRSSTSETLALTFAQIPPELLN